MDNAHPCEFAYAAIRVVRQQEGPVDVPEIVLPSGYALYTEEGYAVSSPGEYYVFLRGPRGVATQVRLHWPGSTISAVIHHKTHLDLKTVGETVVCDIPVTAPSLRVAWPTLEVHSRYDEDALIIRVEHNHPTRRAGYYALHPWVGGQAKASINYLFASRAIFRDWGIHREITAEGLGSIALMGFESNNPLHGDAPAHWHLIYYWPNGTGEHAPHLYMDEQGRITATTVTHGPGRNAETFSLACEQPLRYTDPQGREWFALQMRPDGGIDLGPAVGQWTYSIAPAHDGSFTESVMVHKNGQPWAELAARDDVDAGILTVSLQQGGTTPEPVTETYYYDPLTGAPRRG